MKASPYEEQLKQALKEFNIEEELNNMPD